jgi:hypothetical protein
MKNDKDDLELKFNLANINWRFFFVNFIVGMIILFAGFWCMYWGAHTSCSDGGGRLRGMIPYYQCVLNESNDIVPYMDAVSIKDVPTLCSRGYGTKFVVNSSPELYALMKQDFNNAVSGNYNLTVFGNNIKPNRTNLS